MVRAIVGTLIEIGQGNIDLQGFTDIIEGKDRSLAGFSVPAHGLYLVDIAYPDLRLPSDDPQCDNSRLNQQMLHFQ